MDLDGQIPGLQEDNWDFFENGSDTDSVVSLGSVEGYDIVEYILAETPARNGRFWYLIKWKNCPLVRSSWEPRVVIEDPKILWNWEVEKRRQAEGKSVPFDVKAFNDIVERIETAEKDRRMLRRFRKSAKKIANSIEQNQ